MSDIAKRLRASVRFDAYNGDAHERAVCGKQMLEAAQEIERLQDIAQDAEIRLDERRKIIEELEGRLKQQSSEGG